MKMATFTSFGRAGVPPSAPFYVAFRSKRSSDPDNLGLQVSKRYSLL